jgi:hypothetical protein
MEEPDDFGFWPKQVQVMESVRDASNNGITDIFLIGPVGSTKTFAMAAAHINVAFQFPYSIIPVGRHDMSDSQVGTWQEYTKALRLMGFKQGKNYTVREATNDLRIKFSNGSIIQFVGMNKSRDRDWSKLKITATMGGVDEADDVEKDGYYALRSRNGRRNENGAPRVMLSCCNPNDKWIKYDIYYPWLKRIGRRPENMGDEEWDAITPLPKNIMVIEFTMEDSPLYLKGFYDTYADYPQAWRERYLFNNWSYRDDENSLFKTRVMDSLTITRLEEAERFIAVDPNAGGKDRAAIVLWEGDTAVDAEVYTTEQLKELAEPDEMSPVFNSGAILGRLTIEMAKRERVPAHNIAGDVVGIGQGWLTHMLSNGYDVQQFRSGASPHQTAEEKQLGIVPPYQDLRSQVFHNWSMALERREAFFYAHMPHLATLKKELEFHEADTTSKVMKVTPKDIIKISLGGSPDIADAAMMGWWLKMLRAPYIGGGDQRASVGQSYDEMYNGG